MRTEDESYMNAVKELIIVENGDAPAELFEMETLYVVDPMQKPIIG